MRDNLRLRTGSSGRDEGVPVRGSSTRREKIKNPSHEKEIHARLSAIAAGTSSDQPQAYRTAPMNVLLSCHD